MVYLGVGSRTAQFELPLLTDGLALSASRPAFVLMIPTDTWLKNRRNERHMYNVCYTPSLYYGW